MKLTFFPLASLISCKFWKILSEVYCIAFPPFPTVVKESSSTAASAACFFASFCLVGLDRDSAIAAVYSRSNASGSCLDSSI